MTVSGTIHSFIHSFIHSGTKSANTAYDVGFCSFGFALIGRESCKRTCHTACVLCLSVFMHDLKFYVSVLLKLCVRICSLCTMAEERTVSRCLMVRVEISETSLADLKQFVTEKGGKLIDGKCLQ